MHYSFRGSGYVMSVKFVIFLWRIRFFDQVIPIVAGVAYDSGYAHAAVNCHPGSFDQKNS